MQKEDILKEIDRTAKENGGKPLGAAKFEIETGIKITDWRGRHWARWSDAIKEAGYEPNEFQQAYSGEKLIQHLIDLIRELGKIPTSDEIRLKSYNDKSFPNEKTFSRCGNQQERIQKILDYCQNEPQLQDVYQICSSYRNPKSDAIVIKAAQKEIEQLGYVYLIQSDKYFKIGRSNSAGRREYELKIQLPEKTKLVHEIATDDPIGIEAYWHRRFVDKRKNGEWFALTSTDVKAFIKRKFM